MIDYIYCIKDDVSGKFTLYGNYVNKGTAERDFQIAVNSGRIPPTDYTLFECGEFNHDTGDISGYDSPIFIARGRKNEVQE